MSPTLLHRNQRIHAKQRAEERFGISLNRFVYAELVKQARAAVPIKLQNRMRKVVTIVFPTGQTALAIYDWRHRTIITFLSEGMAY